MKRRSKLLLYVFTMSFFSLMGLFFFYSQVSAFSYVCIDSTTQTECDPDITDYEGAYYAVVEIYENDIKEKEINGQTVKYLEIPDTNDLSYDEYTTYTIPVKVIGDGINPLIQYSDSYILDEIILSSNTAVINTNSLAGFAYVKNITIPQTVELIENHIFNPNSIVENIYFNAYKFSNNMDDYIQINNLAFAEGVVNNVICENHTIYDYYYQNFPHLKYDYLLTKITYHYYEYEGAVSELDSREYYVGKKVLVKDSDVLEGEDVVGLTFIGWRVKNQFNNYNSLKIGEEFYFDIGDLDYDVYPDFSLNPVENIKVKYTDGNTPEQILTSGVLEVTYDGLTRVLSISYDVHPVATQNIVWTKGNEIVDPNIYNIYDSGTFVYKITSAYSYQGQNYTIEQTGSVEVVLSKRNIVVTADNIVQTYGEGLKVDSCTYSVDNLLAIHTIREIRCSYGANELNNVDKVIENVGEYPKSINVELLAIKQIDGGNEKDNYSITYISGNYKVNQKEISVAYTEGLEVEYGNPIEIKNIYQDKETNESIAITYGKEAGLTVGEYSIVSAQSTNPNYYAILDSVASVGKIKIIPRGIELSFSLSSTVYDGNPKTFDVYYIDIVTKTLKNVDYALYKGSQQVDEIVTAGSYQAKVLGIEDENYYIKDHQDLVSNPCFFNFNIAKATPVITKADTQIVEYSGIKIKPHAIVNNTEQTPNYICLRGNEEDPNGCVKSGTYSVLIRLDESENYSSLEGGHITLIIKARMIYLTPREYTFYYNEEIDIKELMEIENADGRKEVVELVYVSDAVKGAVPGKYELKNAYFREPGTKNDILDFSPSFVREESKQKVKIVSRPVEVVYFDYTDLVYDGLTKQVGSRIVDKFTREVIRDVDLTLVCEEGEIKEAKTYHLRTYINDQRYHIDNTNLLEFKIAKAVYDMKHIRFIDKRVILDFKKHGVSIIGALPKGVEVVYTIDGKEGNSTSKAFEHKVIATFVGDAVNYMPIESMEATIYIDMSWVFISVAMLILLSGLSACIVLLHIKYRRVHPKKIKLKIRNIVQEDLEAKRIATSVKEVLGDEDDEEQELLEDDNDLIDETSIANNFIDRIYAASSELKYYYSEVKNELLSYSGVMHTVDRKYEVFYHGPRQIAKLSICNNVLKLYVNLAPEKYDKEQYKHRDMSKFECHARTPLRIDVNTTEALRHAKVFIRILRKKENLKASSDFVRIDYEKFYTLKENIIPKLFKKMFNSGKDKQKTKK